MRCVFEEGQWIVLFSIFALFLLPLWLSLYLFCFIFRVYPPPTPHRLAPIPLFPSLPHPSQSSPRESRFLRSRDLEPAGWRRWVRPVYGPVDSLRAEGKTRRGPCAAGLLCRQVLVCESEQLEGEVSTSAVRLSLGDFYTTGR